MDLREKLLSSPQAEGWKRVGVKHHHGINVPLFSLYSHQSCGIGEFTDLPLLFEWCRSIGFDTIQTLPINDTGPDSSPYSALSSIALNPIHLGLAHLPEIKKLPSLLKQIEAFQELNSASRVLYKKVRPLKYTFFRDYYELMGKKLTKTPEYLSFVNANPWLEGYALFKTIKVRNKWSSWKTWDKELQNPTQATIKKQSAIHRLEIDFHIFLQYLCHLQMEQVAREAMRCGIFLKGDVPILINSESADVWLHPALFKKGYTAGAPPDKYFPACQNWGTPIYDWNAHRKDHFQWWKDRIQTNASYFPLVRIDHIIGFFRFFAIPEGEVDCNQGRFIPDDHKELMALGEEIIRTLSQCSDLLYIGEDLGPVPNRVKTIIQELGICGTRVVRWEREGEHVGPYLPLDTYPPVSMTTISTHDTSTFYCWWQEHPEDAEVFASMMGWKYQPELSEKLLHEILSASHRNPSLFHINLLQEYMSLFQEFQTKDRKDERVNLPGTVCDTNWSIRYTKPVEEIISHEGLKQAMLDLF